MKDFQIDIKFIPCNCNIWKDMSRMMGHFENIKKDNWMTFVKFL